VYHVTMTDLIHSLRKAAAHPEAHSSAQQSYFSDIRENSVLVNCGTACCIAGDLMLQEHVNNQATEDQLNTILDSRSIDPDEWATRALGLSDVESVLAFDSNTHYEVHLLLADLLEAGLRLPGDGLVSMSYESTYTEFHRAYLDDEKTSITLNELKDWMRSIAK
jgi:hypothetical protein